MKTNLKYMFFTNKIMTTMQQLERQRQDVLKNLNHIINEPKIAIIDKMPIIKELSRPLANILEQINKMTVGVKETKAERRKEEIKEIQRRRRSYNFWKYQRKQRKVNGVCLILSKLSG
jgi:hypothetical protein